MPRPYPPPLIVPPTRLPFSLSESDKKSIARTLDLHDLPATISEQVAHAIECYKATANSSSDTTVANTRAALEEILNKGRAYTKAVARLADDRSAVDYTTHVALQPLAKAVIEGRPDASAVLASAAQKRIAELCLHPRIETRVESLRHFCGCLRIIFNNATYHLRGQVTLDRAWRQCRQFALEVFTVAGIDHADFIAHPERLKEYLETDTSTG